MKIWSTCRGVLPLRKVKEDRAALTSYYGKVFISRSERTVHDYGAWLAKRIIAMDEGDDSPFKNIHFGRYFDSSFKVPRAYSGISKRIASFTHNDIDFNFDYASRERLYGNDVIKAIETDDTVICGKTKDGYVLMDSSDLLWTTKGTSNKAMDELGTIEGILAITGKVPVDMAEIAIFNKPIAVGIVLGYRFGLHGVLKMLRVKHRFVVKGTNLELADNEYVVRFKDESLVLSRNDKLAALVLSGFNMFAKQIKEYPSHAFDKRETYSKLLAAAGFRPLRFLREIDLMFDMFIDHITLELLREIKEPEELDKLILRACELLITDDHPEEIDTAYTRYRGYERFSGMVYTELIQALRTYKAKPLGPDSKLTLNPYAVGTAINRDATVTLVEESNPIHALKESELVTYGGAGGRSARSMTKDTRLYHENSIGTISEATVDSAKVAINVSMSADPNFKSIRGTTERYDPEKDTLVNVLSTTANLMPAVTNDD